MKTDLSQSCDHCWVFQICWHIECSTFTAPSLRIWNNATGLPSPPLALFVVMLPIWLHIPGCPVLGEWSHHCDYLGHEDFFIQLFCIFLPPLLDIFCFCEVHTITILYWAVLYLCMKCSLGFSNFLEEISCLSHSIVFLCFFALIAEEGFLLSPCYSLELCIQIGISFLFSFAFHLSSQLFVRPPQTAILLFYISFSWGWSWSLSPVQCHKPLSIVHQALCLTSSPLNPLLTSTV